MLEENEEMVEQPEEEVLEQDVVETEDEGEEVDETQEESDESSEEAPAEPQVTFEDFEKDYDERKSNVQKRIDKLTAEKHQYKSELDALREEVRELQNKKETEQVDKPKYSEEQLRKAFDKAVADGDSDLQWQIQDELAKLRVWEAEQKYLQQNANSSKQADEEARVWKGILEQYSFETDPDFNVKDPNSLIIKVARKLLTDERSAQFYNALGSSKYAAVIGEAKSYILEMRMKKQTNSKTKQLEKNLEKERLKTSLGTGSSGIAKTTTKKKVLNDDRVDHFNKLFGV